MEDLLINTVHPSDRLESLVFFSWITSEIGIVLTLLRIESLTHVMIVDTAVPVMNTDLRMMTRILYVYRSPAETMPARARVCDHIQTPSDCDSNSPTVPVQLDLRIRVKVRCAVRRASRRLARAIRFTR